MVMDCDAQILYVFGGRVFDGDRDTVKYSGLYSYNVRLSKWRMLQYVPQPIISFYYSLPFILDRPTLPARLKFIFPHDSVISSSCQILAGSLASAGHSMVFEPTTRTLYIFAGQRDGKYLSDMYAYDIATNAAVELYSNFTASGGPNACFTQRAVIDSRLKELYV
jgi:hypothetical protein